MTAWHDQPPLSRRQVNGGARGDTVASDGVTDEQAEPARPATRREAVASGRRRVQWDPSARGADGPEPLTYVTQARIPSADGGAEAPPAEPLDKPPAVTSHGASNELEPTSSEAVPLPSEEAEIVTADNPAFRVRDYRPDPRRPPFTPLSPGGEGSLAEQTRPWTPPSDPADLEAPQTPADSPPPPLEHMMTRRELRARERDKASVRSKPGTTIPATGDVWTSSSTDRTEAPVDAATRDIEEQSAVEVEQAIPELIEPDPSRRFHAVPQFVEPEAVGSEAVGPEVVEQGIVESEVVEISDAGTPGVDAGTEVIEAELEPEPEPTQDIEAKIEALREPEPEQTSEAESSSPDVPSPGVVNPFDAQFRSPVGADTVGPDTLGALGAGATDVQRGVEPAPDIAAIPFGHWTAGMPTVDDTYDDERTDSATLSRNVGVTTDAITTHALVLPSVPQSNDQLLTPLASTGEIMATDSIDLPRSFGSTGVHPALFDHPDVDALIDESDREDAASDSAPVRAIRAVSSNTSTRGVIEAPGPRKSRIPLILGGSAAVALLVATGIVAGGFIFNVF